MKSPYRRRFSTQLREPRSLAFSTFQWTEDGSYAASVSNSRMVALMTPAPGETIFSSQELRLVASAGAHPSGADSLVFLANGSSLGSATKDGALNTFHLRCSGLTAGTYDIVARATWTADGGPTHDSRAFTITVVDPPSYGSTVTLSGDTSYVTIGALAGSAGSRIKVDGAGFSITGSAANDVSWDYVDFYNLGATSGDGVFDDLGADVTTTGNVSVTNCRFINCETVKITSNGSGTVAFNNNLWPSTSRNPVNDQPSTSMACWRLTGTSTGTKTFKGNNVAAGWVELFSASWTVGSAGSTDADSNVLIGPRCGIWTSGASFSGTVRLNFSLCLYYGGWSQGSNFEFESVVATTEHNVIAGGSWPMRGLDSTVRYNAFLADYNTEGFWSDLSSAGDVHHNVFRSPAAPVGRGIVFFGYAGTPAVRNCTLDAVTQSVESSFYVNDAGVNAIINSCLLVSPPANAVHVGAGTLTTDYNGFDNAAGAHYSDARSPTHDVTASSGVAGFATWMPFDLSAVWKRTLTVRQMLSVVRTKYTPTNSALDAGDAATYGSNNPIGAVRRSGAGANANDLLGTL